MIELWKILGVFGGAFVVGFSGAVVPGPMFAATVMHARSRGWLAGVLVSSGHALAEVPMVVAIALGGGVVFRNPIAARTIALAGGAVLVVMGALSAARPPDPPRADSPADAAPAGTWLSPLLAGAWTSVSQPYWFIWWATAGASWVMLALAQSGPTGAGAFYVGHILSDFVWFTFVAAAVGAGRKIIPPAAFRVILKVCAIALVAFGLLFVSLGLFWPEKLKGASGADPTAGRSSHVTVERDRGRTQPRAGLI
ncbi:MAG: LysE family transporter [Planctomycetota bacterium]|jgi:threonine/homoserine/homoserine lactone efflux protein